MPGARSGWRPPYCAWKGCPRLRPITPTAAFFAVTVLITTYHTFSEWLSLLVKTRSSQAVKKLLDLRPDTARVVRDGTEVELDLDAVAVGDLVRIRPGERVPVDGLVRSGFSALDLSMVSGEPVPVERGPGEEVVGGSVNGTGTLLVEVTRVGEETFLSQIVRHVEDARVLKPGILHLVDRVLRVYTPLVLAASALALLAWLAGTALTGDNQRAVAHIAGQVGISEVHAEVHPDDKARVVRDLQEGGQRVAMVGDGINDAPALMQADVGIVIGTGTDIAVESADIILVRDHLHLLLDAHRISLTSYRKAKQNVALAFSFNGIGIPAATGLVYPVWAMIAMAASVTVIFANSIGARPTLLFTAISSVGRTGTAQAQATEPEHAAACWPELEGGPCGASLPFRSR